MFSKRQLFLQHVAQTSDFPMCLEVSHASGMYIYGTDGKNILILIPEYLSVQLVTVILQW